MKSSWPRKMLIKESWYALLLGLLFLFSLLSLRCINQIEAINFIFFSLFPLFALFVATRKDHKLSNTTYTKLDIFFLLFLLIAFLSISWSDNKSFAWSKSINWLLIYLFYRSLHWLDIKINQTQLVRSIFILALAISFFYLVILHIQGKINIRSLENIHRYVLGNPNYILSNLLLMSIFVGTTNFRKSRTKILGVIIVGFTMALILISKSQSVKLLMLLNLLAILSWSYPKWKAKNIYLKPFLLSSCLIFTAFVLLQTGLYKEFITEVLGLSDRFVMWKQSLLLCKSHPIQGVGFGNWIHEIYCLGTESFGPGILRRTFVHAHSVFFETLAELGIIGIGLLVPLLTYPLYAFSKIEEKRFSDFGHFLVYFSFLIQCGIYGVVYMQTHLFSLTPFLGMLAAFELIKSSKITKKDTNLHSSIFAFTISMVLIWFVYLFCMKDSYRDIRHSKDLNRKEKLERLLELREFSILTHLHSPRQSWSELIIPFYHRRKHKFEIKQLFEEALDLDPCNTTLMSKFSRYLYQQKEYAYSFRLNLRLQNQDSRSSENILLMAKNLYHLGDFIKADSIFQKEQDKLLQFQTEKAIFKENRFYTNYPDSLFISNKMIRKTKYEVNLEKELKEVQNLFNQDK